MGIFRPLVGKAQTTNKTEVDHTNDRPFTPADALTVSRPIIALEVSRRLLSGQGRVFPLVAVMAATDAEGNLARFIDSRWPDSGWGSTEHGARRDTYADTAALLMVSAAALRAPRVTAGAKLAIGTVLGQEAIKTGWALHSNMLYGNMHDGERLELPVSLTGKEAMAEKFAAVALAVGTHDAQTTAMRAGLTIASLGFAGAGALRGEAARQEYIPLVEQLLDQYPHGEHPMAQVHGSGIHWSVNPSKQNPNQR